MKKLILFLYFFSTPLFSLSYQSQKVKEKNLSWIQREKQIVEKFFNKNPELLPQLATLTFATFMKLLHHCIYLCMYSHACLELNSFREQLRKFENNIKNKEEELAPDYKCQNDVGKVIATREYAARIGAPDGFRINIPDETMDRYTTSCEKIKKYELEFNAKLGQKENLRNFEQQYYIQTALTGLFVGSELGFISFIIIKYLIFRFSQCEEIDEESEFEDLAYNERFKQFERSRKQQREIQSA